MTGRLPAAWRHYPPVERAGYHLARARAWARRATVPGLSVRGVVWLSGLAALLAALPGGQWLGPVLPVAAAFAVLPAAAPGSSWVAVLELIAISTVAVRAASSAADPSLPVVLLTAALLYGHHTAAALAAQLRTDAVAPVAVLRHWALRAGLVAAGSVLVGLVVAAVAGSAEAGPDTGYLAVGVAAAVAVAALAGWLLRRRSGIAGAAGRSLDRGGGDDR